MITKNNVDINKMITAYKDIILLPDKCKDSIDIHKLAYIDIVRLFGIK